MSISKKQLREKVKEILADTNGKVSFSKLLEEVERRLSLEDKIDDLAERLHQALDPDGIEETESPVLDYDPKMLTKPGMYIAMGCMHVPGHNIPLYEGIVNLIQDHKEQLAGLILMGDILDCASLSSYSKGKELPIRGLTLEEEYEQGREVISTLTNELSPSTTRTYIYGNHEDRWRRYMSDLDDQKRPLPSPADGLDLNYHNFDIFDNCSEDFVTLGKHLELMHGQYFNVHCAKKHIDNYRGSVMFVHTHRIQTYIEGAVGGFNIGWLGDVDSPLFNYMPRGTRKQWQNGFAIVNVDEAGDYFTQQIVCHNSKFYFNNKVYGKKNYKSIPNPLHSVSA